ncbi:prophage PSPPH06 head completion/stabilization protein [Pseudomonas sp. StFLB209]|uniref:head completion/stabilization protein n=1 Tax=Pseudomonas sp. StFLB209 TaxID=1028989 RepID=UPI0004F66F9C|nr:head completion/stabilization protein [Pseudomonas sp. StFLB209]BAP43922.1 prophage PSPPH06 head completion/stabilization protein [Pseudomonas sp. StFLB209]
MGFSGTAAAIAPPQQIENDGFWPNLDLSEFQRIHRLPGNLAVDLQVTELKLARGAVNTDLAKLKARWQASGVSNVESADTTILPERTYQVDLYKQAVYYRAKAKLLPQFATTTRRETAENTGKEAPESTETLLKFSQEVIRALQGRSRITAALL